MSSIIIPENILYNALESVIKYVRRDLEEYEKDEKKSMLYRLLGENIDGKPLSMNRWNFFRQAKKIFLDKNNLSVNFGYNFEVAKIISLHIILPSEQAAESAIGQDEGYGEDEEDLTTSYFTQNFTSNYQVMITSNNSSEVMTVYHILKSLLLMIIPHLEIMGLRLNKLSGNDIMFRDEMMPNGIFHKVLNISCNYELKVPQIWTREIIKGIIINNNVVELLNTKDESNESNGFDKFDNFTNILVQYRKKLSGIILVDNILDFMADSVKDGLFLQKDDNARLTKLIEIKDDASKEVTPLKSKIYSCSDNYYIFNGEIFVEIGDKKEILLSQKDFENLEKLDEDTNYFITEDE